MTKILFLLLSLIFVVSAAAPPPVIGSIDYYGLRSVSEKQIADALLIKPGDAPPKSREDAAGILKRLRVIPGVIDADIDIPCCDEKGKSILYVGIREKGSHALKFREAPKGEIRLPAKIFELNRAFYEALEKAVMKGEMAEDESAGHAISKNAEVRAVQEKFIPIADKDQVMLRNVIRGSADAEHRAFAVQVIAYSTDKRKILNELVSAVSDGNSSVRNAAIRALWVIAVYARKHPEKKIDVPVGRLVDLLNSLVWTDRNKASLTLMALTESRDPKLLRELKEKALSSLFEMARWKNPGHTFAAVIILGRTAGIADGEIFAAMQDGKKNELLIRVSNILRRTE